MTKREFDRITRENWGGPLASDERRNYRAWRMRSARPGDFLGWRWRTRRSMCAPLAIGCRWRTVADYRRRHGMPLTVAGDTYPGSPAARISRESLDELRAMRERYGEI